MTGPTDGEPAEAVLAANPRRVERAVMLQGWHDLGSVHWAYDPAVVQALLPDGFRVDTFAGTAWVGLIPFELSRSAFGPLPHVPYFGRFAETNVRLYGVGADGRTVARNFRRFSVAWLPGRRSLAASVANLHRSPTSCFRARLGP